MSGNLLGGGVIFVVAAVLWAAVLVPSWLKRKQFKAAERNALRLQRTLRVLAETSEVPEEVRVEATAREALAREKMLRTARKQQEAERRAELADARAAQVRAELIAAQKQRRQQALERANRLRRPVVRRVRAVAALAALLGMLAAVVGLGMAVAGAGAAVLLWSLAATAVAAGVLVLLAPGRTRVQVPTAEQQIVREVPSAPQPAAADVAREAEERRRAELLAEAREYARAQAEAAAQLHEARERARARAKKPAVLVNREGSMLLERRAAESVTRSSAAVVSASSAPVAERPARVAGPADVAASARKPAAAAPTSSAAPTTVAPTAAAPSTPDPLQERLRAMGVVGDTSEGMPNLDEVLRRRRTAA